MGIKTKCSVILSLVLFLLVVPSLVSADRGMILIGPKEVWLEESAQNAIVAWNGKEEVIILSTDTRSLESTLVLEVLPLPSNPTKVEEGNFDSFVTLTEIVNKKVKAIREREGYKAFGIGAISSGIEITFHKKIGAHDVTIVKVSDLDYFIGWIKNFTISKGFKYREISPEFKDTVAEYLDRGINFFVFDVIEVGKDRRSIKPLIYKFETNYLYYPLKITATSDAKRSFSEINLFLIAEGIINKSAIKSAGLRLGVGFDHYIELSKDELKEVSPEIAKLFNSAYVMNVHYFGPLQWLEKDLMVYHQDIYVPTFFDKISRIFSASLIFSTVSEMWKGTFSGYAPYAPIWARVVSAVILFSFIFGIPSAMYIVTRLIQRLLRKFNLESLGYSLLASATAFILILAFLLLSNVDWLAISALAILAIVGFSMLVYLTVKLFKKYIF